MPDIKIKPPQAIIIVGASRDRAKYGNKAVRAFRDVGSKVLAINPFTSMVEGVRSYARVEDLPAAAAKLASIYTKPAVTKKLLPALARYGVEKIFFNPGSESTDLVTMAKKIGMQPILACSVTAIGKDPEQY